MNPVEIIKNFVEGKMAVSEFENAAYTDKALESLLSSCTSIPPYTNGRDLFLFVVSANFKDVGSVLNIQDALSQFLRQQGIPHVSSPAVEKTFNLMLGTQPKWLDMPGTYFSSMLEQSGGLEGKQLRAWLKDEIAKRFRYLTKPPKWLQAPRWPIVEGVPAVFVGSLDIGSLGHDEATLFVFFNEKDRSFVHIAQSA